MRSLIRSGLRSFPVVNYLFVLEQFGEVRNVKERIPLKCDVYESGLHTWQDLHYAAFVQIANNTLIFIAAFDIELGNYAVLNNGDFLFAHICTDNHLFCHELSYTFGSLQT